MSSYIPQALAKAVRERADHRCEYCRLAQAGQEATFHVDHIYPRRLGGKTVIENLALACVSCSLRKGATVEAPDPETSALVAFFHPRHQVWWDHFKADPDGTITGITSPGRATASHLKMNRPLALQIRAEEILRQRFP